jgi:membrane protease YdiL (CAAX protease family)
MKRLATNRPLLFVITILLGWIVASGLAAMAAAALFHVELTTNLAQSMGTLTATGLLVVAAWRMGWLRSAGIARPGGWRTWLLTLLIGLYLYAAYRYAFFGTLASDPGILLRLPEARAALLRQVVVGTVEELLFRAVLLYALVRAWASTRRGLLAAVAVPALLFGSLHILQFATGNELAQTLATIVNAIVGGIWLGALVLRRGSVWPAVALHAMTNLFVNIGAMAVPGYTVQASAIALATLLELPLLLLAGWWLLHRPLAARPGRSEDDPGGLSVQRPASPQSLSLT